MWARAGDFFQESETQKELSVGVKKGARVPEDEVSRLG